MKNCGFILEFFKNTCNVLIKKGIILLRAKKAGKRVRKLMDDKKIIGLLFSRSETAINELETKFGSAIKRLCFNILGNREDAEECANDTYFAVWKAIPPAEPSNLLPFVLKIARNLALKRVARNTAMKRDSRYDVCLSEIEACLPSKDSIESEFDKNELTKMLEAFALSLDTVDRALFLRRYWYFESAKDSASALSMTENNVNVRLARIRKKLKNYLAERGVEV